MILTRTIFAPNAARSTNRPEIPASAPDGSVIRVDGINEQNHQNSFVHAELHEENRERKAAGLSKGVRRSARAAVSRPGQAAYQKGKASGKGVLAVIAWIIFIIIALNVLGNLMFLFL